MPIFRLSNTLAFPSPHFARNDGLLAVGGDLTRERILLAYEMGIFPWYSEDDPILWWSPNPRLILYPKEFRFPGSLKKVINKQIFDITLDTAFEDVIMSCAQVRLESDEGTWIMDEMIEAYCKLHESGFAHSVEAWKDGKLAGGLYGVSLGRCFFGESMFARASNASKVAFVRFVKYLETLSFDMIDCQVTTDHLLRFGAREIPRSAFLKQLERSLRYPTRRGKWRFDG